MASKLLVLEATDGLALIGYCGLGLTEGGTEPSEWMSRVLRGMRLSLRRSMEVLATAVRDRLSSHLPTLPPTIAPLHQVVAVGFEDHTPVVYLLNVGIRTDNTILCEASSYRRSNEAVPPLNPPAFIVAGDGMSAVPHDRAWGRSLRSLHRAFDAGRISDRAFADELAARNRRVAESVRSVSRECIVAWRARDRNRERGTGGHHFYGSTVRLNEAPALPEIAGGVDVKAVFEAMLPAMADWVDRTFESGVPADLDTVALNEALAQLPETPDPELK